MRVWGKLKDFWIQCKRVLRITKKPDKQEFMTIVKVSGLGILVIGLIGFLLHIINQVIIG
jgi:protein transport protein SEC61 subunit gamma-like protein